jgi:hypothetical protein
MVLNLTWLENLTKPFASLFNPIAERIGNRLGRRKPRLYVHVQAQTSLWCIAQQGTTELMQVMFSADLNHDDHKHGLAIIEAYLEGTRVEIGMMDKFVIPPNEIVTERIGAMVLPVKGEKGKPYTGRFILVDQFKRKHKTEKITFKSAGPSQT